MPARHHPRCPPPPGAPRRKRGGPLPSPPPPHHVGALNRGRAGVTTRSPCPPLIARLLGGIQRFRRLSEMRSTWRPSNRQRCRGLKPSTSHARSLDGSHSIALTDTGPSPSTSCPRETPSAGSTCPTALAGDESTPAPPQPPPAAVAAERRARAPPIEIARRVDCPPLSGSLQPSTPEERAPDGGRSAHRVAIHRHPISWRRHLHLDGVGRSPPSSTTAKPWMLPPRRRSSCRIGVVIDLAVGDRARRRRDQGPSRKLHANVGPAPFVGTTFDVCCRLSISAQSRRRGAPGSTRGSKWALNAVICRIRSAEAV